MIQFRNNFAREQIIKHYFMPFHIISKVLININRDIFISQGILVLF